MNNNHLQGKTAIITGAGYATLSDGRCGSIGYGIATAFAKEGANLVITGRQVPKLEKAKAELERLYGVKVLAIPADISAGADNAATAKAVVDAAMAEFGRIDVLINNAQASASGVTIQDHTTEQFDLAIYSGLYATFYYMQTCYPYLKETRGSIINFASGAGLFGNYGQCAYAAAKEGANLVITCRQVPKLEKAKEELEKLYGVKVLAIPADISAGADNAATAKAVVDAAIAEFGRIDVLINNAQASASGVTIQDHTTEQNKVWFSPICQSEG